MTQDIEIVTNVTAKQAFLMLAVTEMKPFTADDWSAFAGCESASPTLGECEGHILVLDGSTLLVIAEGDEGGGQTFELPDAGRAAAIGAIAKTVLGLVTLETRKSDGLDFSDQSVWNIKAALEAAYEAGKRAR